MGTRLRTPVAGAPFIGSPLPGQNPINHYAVPRPSRASRNLVFVHPRRTPIKPEPLLLKYFHPVQGRGFAFVESVRRTPFAFALFRPLPGARAAQFQLDLRFVVFGDSTHELAHELAG